MPVTTQARRLVGRAVDSSLGERRAVGHDTLRSRVRLRVWIGGISYASGSLNRSSSAPGILREEAAIPPDHLAVKQSSPPPYSGAG